jgi:hypothetical protein
VDNHAKLLFIVEIKIMKLNFLKPVLICALTMGLMTFAPGKSQAGVVIGNQLYTPVKLKLVVTYYDANGNFKKLSIAAKDILNLQGYPPGDQLAVGPAGDVYVIDKHTVLTDLTATGYLFMNFNQLLYSATQPDSGGASTFTELGILSVNYYSDGGLDDPSGHSSGYWFEVSGSYARSGKESAIASNQQTVNTTLKASALAGQGFALAALSVNANNIAPLPLTGSASGSGSGKVQAPQ